MDCFIGLKKIFLFVLFFLGFSFSSIFSYQLYDVLNDGIYRFTSGYTVSVPKRGLGQNNGANMYNLITSMGADTALNGHFPGTFDAWNTLSMPLSNSYGSYKIDFLVNSPLYWFLSSQQPRSNSSNVGWGTYSLPSTIPSWMYAQTGSELLSSFQVSGGIELDTRNIPDWFLFNFGNTTKQFWDYYWSGSKIPMNMYAGAFQISQNFVGRFPNYRLFYWNDNYNGFYYNDNVVSSVLLPQNYIGFLASLSGTNNRVIRNTIRVGTPYTSYIQRYPGLYYSDVENNVSYWMQVYSGSNGLWETGLEVSQFCPAGNQNLNFTSPNMQILFWLFPNSSEWSGSVADGTAIPYKVIPSQFYCSSTKQDLIFEWFPKCNSNWVNNPDSFSCVYYSKYSNNTSRSATFTRLFGDDFIPPSPPVDPCIANPNLPECGGGGYTGGIISPNLGSGVVWSPSEPTTIKEAIDNLESKGLDPVVCQVGSSYTGMSSETSPFPFNYFSEYIYGGDPDIVQFVSQSGFYEDFLTVSPIVAQNQLLNIINISNGATYKTFQYRGTVVVGGVSSEYISNKDIAFYCYWKGVGYTDDLLYGGDNGTSPNSNGLDLWGINLPWGSGSEWNTIDIDSGLTGWNVLVFGLLSLFIIQAVNIIVRRPKL